MTRCLLLVLGLLIAGREPASAQSVTDEIRSVVHSGAHPYAITLGSVAGDELREVYEGSSWTPLWSTNGRPHEAAVEMVQALQASEQEGLWPADYAAVRLAAETQRLDLGSTSERQLALFDTALTSSALRFVSDRHDGRVDAAQVGFGRMGKQRDIDLSDFVIALASAPDPSKVLRELDPSFPVYRRLRSALAWMRELARREPVPPPSDMPVLRPADSSNAVPVLRRFLEVLGDLPIGQALVLDPQVYDPALVEAVRRFQDRHGLEIDGVVGPATLRQMRVPLSERVWQIELAMERLRWLPASRADRYVIVNIPAFRLLAFESGEPQPRLTMDVVVGKAAGLTKTPVLRADMTKVVFRPYWNVPASIAKNEILPRVRRDPGYLSRQRMEIINGRVRQRPGDNNALGLVKFLFPNPYHVYMHDTPARALFARTRRDFSHGCIRLAEPAALAAFVLSNRPDWDRQRIDQAMHQGKDDVPVQIEPTIPVYLFYATAIVDHEERLRFFEDLYSHDATLRRMLADYRG